MREETMKVVIAGSRHCDDYSQVLAAISDSGFIITEVVSGGNGRMDEETEKVTGVDLMGDNWAIARDITVKRFPADWYNLGRSAGPIRNEEMAKYADALIAVWDGKSRGTQNMIYFAKVYNLKTHVHRIGKK